MDEEKGGFAPFPWFSSQTSLIFFKPSLILLFFERVQFVDPQVAPLLQWGSTSRGKFHLNILLNWTSQRKSRGAASSAYFLSIAHHDALIKMGHEGHGSGPFQPRVVPLSTHILRLSAVPWNVV